MNVVKDIKTMLENVNRVADFLVRNEGDLNARIANSLHPEHTEFWEACLSHNHMRQVDNLNKQLRFKDALFKLTGRAGGVGE